MTLYCQTIMTRAFVLVINVLLVGCMLVASPLLPFLLVAPVALRGARRVGRKLKHRHLGCTRIRRRARPNLYPEGAI